MRPLEECDPVVLPSGRRAVLVAKLPDGRWECQCCDDRGRPVPDDLVTLPERMLRRIEPGRPVPPPMRIRDA